MKKNFQVSVAKFSKNLLFFAELNAILSNAMKIYKKCEILPKIMKFYKIL
jgi:hypothetical protein